MVKPATGHAAIPNWLLHDPDLSNADKLVFLVINSYARGLYGEAWPSQQSIAESLDLSVRTVKRAIVRLVEAGVLEVYVVRSPHGRRNHYVTRSGPAPPEGGGDTHDPMGGDTRDP